MKLWQKDHTDTQELVSQFTIGNDPEFDLLLAPYDVQGSLAHAQMLYEIGMLSKAEWTAIEAGLQAISEDIQAGRFHIAPGVEDVHSQVEGLLIQHAGEAGKKIHTGRSRNDQVAVDIKLYLRAQLIDIREAVLQLFDLLLTLSEQHKDVLLPGYTHLQTAMPSSFGLWLGAWAESLTDDMDLLKTAYRMCNKNPLGSGAGYGSAFPLNRRRTTELLGFSDLHYNSVYAQMSRGKTEKIVAMALANLAGTLGRFSMDICLYLSQNFDFIQFPEQLTTGSSIMPHKKNPDIFELTRAKCNRIQALPNEFALLLANLPSGYHRDLQLTKEMLFPAIETMKSCLSILVFALPQMQVRKDILQEPKYRYIFSVEAVHQLVRNGAPFRDAYRQVGTQIEKGDFHWPADEPLRHTHEGSMGQLCTEAIRSAMEKALF